MKEGLSTYSALRILNDELKIIYNKNYVRRSLLQYFILSLNAAVLKKFLIANIFLFFVVISELFYSFLYYE